MKEIILGEIAGYLRGELLGDPEVKIYGICGLEEAREGYISFVASPRFLPQAEKILFDPERERPWGFIKTSNVPRPASTEKGRGSK